MKRIFLLLLIVVLTVNTRYLSGQTAYEHLSNSDLYAFIDDMASMHLIEVNTAIKPYSRQQIAGWLEGVDQQRVELSRAQAARLDIYLKEFALEAGKMKRGLVELAKQEDQLSVHLLPPEIVWRDSLFRAILRPIYGIRYFSSTKESFYHSYGGAEAIAYIGKNWAGYASLRDNYQSLEPLAMPTYLTQEAGGNYKIGVQGRSGADFSEMRGGITYSWDWGSIAFIKDHLQWGDAYNGSNILSGHSPSFPMVKLHLNPAKWLEFEYFHGWLVSQVIDSSRSYVTANGDYRAVFREKYIAANMYTFKPFERLRLSVGNSIVYSDVPVQPAYLIPFFFFKSLDHTLNKGIDNQNSSMFFNISTRQIRNLHLFASIFVDEFSVSRIGDPDRHNFTSIKLGGALNGWPLPDLFLASEYTRTNPMTYKHRVPATTYATNLFNLGHYLTDNSEEFFVSVRYAPVSTLQLKVNYTNAVHGNDYNYVRGDIPVDEFPVLKEKSWSSTTLAFVADYLPLPNVRVFAEYSISNVQGYDIDGRDASYYEHRFGPDYLHGKTNTLIIGFGMGF
ncbi:MAG: hypothetical protein PF694_01635 [Bacteroidetes bacterium]|jgi:hypothetical protein|nr:hypothetical protein [Bacteroidota bacterium]